MTGQASTPADSQHGEGRHTVLVADDDERNRRLLAAILAPRYVVLEAHSGEWALETVDRQEVDLVLLDIMMPGLGGLETCQRLKERQPGRQGFLPVVLVTALSSQADRNAGLAAGADEFVSKPFDRAELSLRITGLLERRGQQAQIARQLSELKHLQALKDDLFGFLVHDMNNPLAGVLGYLELLKDHVREAARSVEGAAAKRRITIEVADQDIPDVTLDRRLVQRCVENLLANAIRFTSQEGTIVAGARSEPGRVVVFVADRGPGVAPPMKTHLFEKYLSDDAGAAARRHDFGLGLYFVKVVATAHGGETFVRDREGGGAEFGLALPFTTA